MNTPALIMYLATNIIVTGVTVYFFIKVLRTPPSEIPDVDEEGYPDAHGPKTFDAT